MVQLVELELTLDRTAPIPLYLQLHHQLADLITAQEIPTGARLPASRDLAERLGVNRATVASAYDKLVADGLARSQSVRARSP